MNVAKKRIVVKNRFRFTVFLILLFALISVAVFAFVLPGQTSADISHKTDVVCVAPGDTLWSIAGDYTDGQGDIRELVYRIKTINNLPSADLLAGQTLLIPLD